MLMHAHSADYCRSLCTKVSTMSVCCCIINSHKLELTHTHIHTHTHTHKHTPPHTCTLCIQSIPHPTYRCAVYDGSLCNPIFGQINVTIPARCATNTDCFAFVSEDLALNGLTFCLTYRTKPAWTIVSSSGASTIMLLALALHGMVPSPEMN